jgi:dTDP-glucose 4,6-dehydratase/UDP-glucose 4-epimerase
MQQLLMNKDYLFNLVGQTSHLDSMQNPKTDIDINAVSQISILECCRKFNPGIKVIYASTRQIYGKPQYFPVDENHRINPVDVNGIEYF